MPKRRRLYARADRARTLRLPHRVQQRLLSRPAAGGPFTRSRILSGDKATRPTYARKRAVPLYDSEHVLVAHDVSAVDADGLEGQMSFSAIHSTSLRPSGVSTPRSWSRLTSATAPACRWAFASPT